MKALTHEQRLTAIFDAERKAKAAATRKFDTAKVDCKRMEDQPQAEAALQAAEQAHAAELSAAEEKARSAYTALRAEMAEKVRKASLVNPGDVDPQAQKHNGRRNTNVRLLRGCYNAAHAVRNIIPALVYAEE